MLPAILPLLPWEIDEVRFSGPKPHTQQESAYAIASWTSSDGLGG